MRQDFKFALFVIGSVLGYLFVICGAIGLGGFIILSLLRWFGLI